MKNHEKIITTYQQADATTRLDMFMFYPDLRELFTQIETDETQATLQTQFQQIIRPSLAKHWLLRLRSCCHALLTNILNGFAAK